MKKASLILSILALTVALVALTLALLPHLPRSESSPSSGASSAVTQHPEPGSAEYHARILYESDGELTLCPADGGAGELMTLNAKELQVIGENGRPMDPEDLEPGMTATVFYDGSILSIYPSLFGNPTRLEVTGREPETLSLWLDVLEDLWETDPALNEGATQLAFDLSGVPFLTPGEREALVWLCNRWEYTAFESCYDDLVSEGAVGESGWREGLLITFSAQETPDGRITFEASKWRSPLGALVFTGCEAWQENGEWEYRLGATAVAEGVPTRTMA